MRVPRVGGGSGTAASESRAFWLVKSTSEASGREGKKISSAPRVYWCSEVLAFLLGLFAESHTCWIEENTSEAASGGEEKKFSPAPTVYWCFDVLTPKEA